MSANVLLFLCTLVVDYAIMTCLVGIAWFSLLKRRRATVSFRFSIFSLLVVFAVLDYYTFPAIAALDATFSIRDPELAQIFGLSPGQNAEVMDFTSMGYGTIDLLIWAFQAGLALWIGGIVVPKPISQDT